MKTIITFLLLLCCFNTSAQCSYCPTIKEALLFPEQTKQLNLKYTTATILDSSVNEFKNLKEIDLSYSFIRNFGSGVHSAPLHHLNLSHTFIDPWGFEQITRSFPNLVLLDLSHANLRFLPNKLGILNQLTHLNLSGNQLTHIPEGLEDFQQLTHLNLSDNKLISPSSSIGFLWKLESLNVSGNAQLDLNRLFTSISENKALRELNIDASSLSKNNAKVLSMLSITTLKLNAPTDKHLSFLRTIPSLKKLELKHYSGNSVATVINRFPNINHLTINQSAISEELLKQISIDTLTLSDVENINAQSFTSIKRINVLDLTQSILSKSTIEELIQKLPKTKIVSSIYEEYDYKISNSEQQLVTIPVSTIRHNGNETTTIQEKNATLKIPENAFLTKDGTIYNGTVNIELKVYEDVIELALDSAPMNYYTNGNNEVFGSNGMLYFNATTPNREQLTPNPDAIITVEMRNNIPGNTGSMYLYDSVQQNWTTLPGQASTFNGGFDIQNIIDSVNALDVNTLVPIINNDRKYALTIQAGRYDLPVLEFRSQFHEKKGFPPSVFFNRFNEVGKEFCKYSWVIDTLISKETLSFLKQVQKETRIKQKDLKNKYKPFFPKIIWNLSIVEDYINDNYRLTFNVRDSILTFPVAINGESNNKVQRQHGFFQKKLRQAERKDKKHQNSFDKYYNQNIDRLVKEARDLIIQNAINNQTQGIANSEMIRFGLTGFGLVNCDIITRVEPEDYIVIADQVKDQHGNKLRTPKDVKIILQSQNAYFTNKHNKVPIYSTAITFAIFDKNKLGFFPTNTQEKRMINTVTVYDISNLPPHEIAQLIARQYAQN